MQRLPPPDCDWVFPTYGAGLVTINREYYCWSKGPRAEHHYQRFRCPGCPLSIHLYLYNEHAFLRFPHRWPGAPKMRNHADGCEHARNQELLRVLPRLDIGI